MDGVINSFHKSKNAGWEGDWKLAKIIGYPIHWYTDLVDAINELAGREDVNMIWLTTWQHQAPKELSPVLGIADADWRVLTAADQNNLFDMKNWWKLEAIKVDIEKTEPDKIVWIDDDFKHDRKAIEWVENNSDIDLLPISPFTDWGMTKEDFDDIIEFINA